MPEKCNQTSLGELAEDLLKSIREYTETTRSLIREVFGALIIFKWTERCPASIIPDAPAKGNQGCELPGAEINIHENDTCLQCWKRSLARACKEAAHPIRNNPEAESTPEPSRNSTDGGMTVGELVWVNDAFMSKMADTLGISTKSARMMFGRAGKVLSIVDRETAHVRFPISLDKYCTIQNVSDDDVDRSEEQK